MAVHTHGGTMPGALTPICNDCMIALCYDIPESEYEERTEFWDNWICQECNGGEPLRLTGFPSITDCGLTSSNSGETKP